MANQINKLHYQTVFLIDEELRNSRFENCVKIEDTINLIRCSILRVLTFFSNATEHESCKDFSDIIGKTAVHFEWGFKFFSSSRGDRLFERIRFREFTLKQFEDFETELEAKFNRPFADIGLDRNKVSHLKDQDSHLFVNLQTALERLMHDFPWNRPDITSPVKTNRTGTLHRQSNKRHRFEEDNLNNRRNFVFMIAKCLHTTEEIECTIGSDRNPLSLLGSILRQKVWHEFSEVRRLRLFWIDANITVSDDINGIQLVNDALEHIQGGVIPISSILSLGDSITTHVQSLLNHIESTCSVYDDIDINKKLTKGNKVGSTNASSETIPPSLLVPFTGSMAHYLRSLKQTVAEEEKKDHSWLYLDKEHSKACQITCQPLVISSQKSDTAINRCFEVGVASGKVQNTKGFNVNFQSKCDSELVTASLEVPPTRWCQTLHTVATLSGSIHPILSIQSEKAYIVMGVQKSVCSKAEIGFEDLLLQLSLNGNILVVHCSTFPSSFGFLRPLTSMTATLTFLRDIADLPLDRLLACHNLAEENHESLEKSDSHDKREQKPLEILKQLSAVDISKGTVSDFQPINQQISATRFNPIMLENWFFPECIAQSNDPLLTFINRRNCGVDSEKSLIQQLQSHCDNSRTTTDLLICKTIGAKNNESSFATLTSSVSSRLMPSELLDKLDSNWRQSLSSHNLKASETLISSAGGRTPHKSVRRTPVKATRKTPQKTARKTPQKTPRKSPRKISRKTPRKTPRKSPRKTSRRCFEAVSSNQLRRKSPVKEGQHLLKGSASRLSFHGENIKQCKLLQSGDASRRLSAGSMTAISRTDLILQRSREAFARKNQSEHEADSVKAAGLDRKAESRMITNSVEQETITGWQELRSVEDLLVHLKVMYANVAEGEGSPIIGAKSVFDSALQYFRKQSEETNLMMTCSFLREHLSLSIDKVREKYKGNNAADLECKCREFLLQVCLEFEMNAGSGSDDSSDKTASELASMLSSVAIVKGVNFLITYLADLLESYLDSSAKLLFGVYENLGRPIPTELKHLLSPETDDFNHSLPPPSTQQLHSISSAPSDNSESNDNGVIKKRSIYRHPTVDPVRTKQITVMMQPNKSATSNSRRSARIANAIKLDASQPTDQTETGTVRRTLFGETNNKEISHRLSLPTDLSSQTFAGSRIKSPAGLKSPVIKAHHVLKTKTVAETPEHKQGCNSLQHKLEWQRRQAKVELAEVEVVEESPEKSQLCGDLCRNSNTVKRVKSNTSFYRQKGPIQSRSINRLKKLNERMTQQTTSPPFTVNAETQMALTSPRRIITARVLFGLSPSPPCKHVKIASHSHKISRRAELMSPVKNVATNSTALESECQPKSTLESLGVTFIQSPNKFAMPGMLDFTSPAKNTRLQTRLASSQPFVKDMESQNTEVLNAVSASQDLIRTDFSSPIRNAKHVDISNFLSPVKSRFFETSPVNFTSPAKNTRLQARQENNQKSKQSAIFCAFDESATFTSPRKTESTGVFAEGFSPTTKESLHRDSCDPVGESFISGSPTFGSCKRRAVADGSPVFSFRRGCTNSSIRTLMGSHTSPHFSNARQYRSPKRGDHCKALGDEKNSLLQETGELPVFQKARKRLLASPDSDVVARKKLLLTAD